MSYTNVSVLVQEFVRPKGNCASKLRVHFTNEFQKGFIIFSRKTFTNVKKHKEINIKEFIPLQFLTSSLSFNLYSTIYNEMFRIKPFQPLTNHTHYFEDDDGRFEFLAQCMQVADFLHRVSKIISLNTIEYVQKEIIYNMIKFFRSKVKKLRHLLLLEKSFTRELQENQIINVTNHNRHEWSRKFIVRTSKSEDIDVYEVLSNKKFIPCTRI